MHHQHSHNIYAYNLSATTSLDPLRRDALQIVIVEDHDTHLTLMRSYLKRQGFRNVICFSDPLVFLEQITELDPDVILFDYNMPFVTGAELLQAVVDARGTAYLPVVMVTADSSERLKIDLLCAGAQDVITKPFDYQSFITRIENVLKTRQYYLQGQYQQKILNALLQLQNNALSLPPEEMYSYIVDKAVSLVPGAQAGSLLVRQGDFFVYKAAVGFKLEELRQARFAYQEMHTWSSDDQETWVQDTPYVTTRDQVDFEQLNPTLLGRHILLQHGRLEDIEANMNLTVAYRGEVVAVLNLDNFESREAFNQDAITVAGMFAPTLKALIHEMRYRDLLDKEAKTDPLTGLANRRAFESEIAKALASAKRHKKPFSLLVMDLEGFKKINDSLGHDQGDQVLIAVAECLTENKRFEDELFRWGGDEFAVLLPDTEYQGGVCAAQRLAENVGRLEIQGHRIGINIGVASFPRDGEENKQILKSADARMYLAKSKGVGIILEANLQ